MKRIVLSTGLAAALVVLAAASSFAVDRGTRREVRVSEPAGITMMAIGLGGLAAANFLRKRKK